MAGEGQTSGSLLMVRPAAFGFNPETAATNVFAAAAHEDCARAALAEFDSAAERLAAAGADVLILEDTPDPPRPDAAFPNNWVSFHADGTMVLYPMAAASRRLERRAQDLAVLLATHGFEVRRTVDLTEHERFGRYLEGTGSLVLDRPARRAFAAIGPRTDPEALADFAGQLGYSAHAFAAADARGRPIYHTNVLLGIGARFAVLCLEAVAGESRRPVMEALGERVVVLVDEAQMRGFACNIIELRGRGGEPLIAMSSAARASFRPDQLRQLEAHGTIVEAAIPTIEAVAGGSLRCMIADIHLPRRG